MDLIIVVLLIVILFHLTTEKEVFNRTRVGCSRLGANTRSDGSLYLHCHWLMETPDLRQAADDVECREDNCPLICLAKSDEAYNEQQAEEAKAAAKVETKRKRAQRQREKRNN